MVEFVNSWACFKDVTSVCGENILEDKIVGSNRLAGKPLKIKRFGFKFIKSKKMW